MRSKVEWYRLTRGEGAKEQTAGYISLKCDDFKLKFDWKKVRATSSLLCA